MEASQEKPPEAQAEQSGATAKQMAAAEEQNQVRRLALANQAEAPPEPEATSIMEVASRGYDALQEAFAKHNAKKPKEYVPPPRTERQMSALQEELEAGRRRVAQNEEQLASRTQPKPEPAKEGFTTPVYRPGDMVPDPTINSPSGFAGGTRQFGADAP